MKLHLVDGTYELFRHFFGAPPHRNAAGKEVAAVRGVVGSVLQLLGEGATHVGVATDHVIESFRNDLWPGYKTGAGIDPDLWSQAWPLEEALMALGVLVWPMVDLEADDALASGAAVGGDDPDVDQVVICTPDKDLGQCVRGTRVVQLDRRKDASSTRRASSPISESVRPPSPITSPWSATARTGSRVWRDGAPSRPPPSLPAGATSRTFLPIRPTGRWPSGRGQAGRRPQRVSRRRALVQGTGHPAHRPLAARTGRGLRWRGPTSDFARVCADLDGPGLLRRAEALAATR